MTKLARAIAKRQDELGLTDRVAAEKLSTLQQTFSTWKRGTIPRQPVHAALSAWLGISIDELDQMIEEAKTEAPAINLTTFANARQYGKIADRKTGKFRFGTGRHRVPSGRYQMRVDTKVMDPIFLVGSTIWLDPAIPAQIDNDVVVHAEGFGWIGCLVGWDAAGARLERNNGEDMLVPNVEAIHVIVLSSRV